MDNFINVVGINQENCINCHQCIAVCPVKVCSNGSGEVVEFDNRLCIGCGRCIEACIKSHGGIKEESARFPIDDSTEFVNNLGTKEIIALIAPSAQSNFNLRKLISALRIIGIKAVYDVSLGAEITIACYHELIKSDQVNLPIIAQPCPAVVKYIEIHHPLLIKYLAPTGSPVHNTAVYAKKLHPDCQFVFISPCLAKRREFQDSKMIAYNVTYQSLINILAEKNINLSILEDSEFDNDIAAGIAANFPTPGGLKESYLRRYPETPASSITKIEGPFVYEKYLKDLEKSIVSRLPDLPLIVDILSCETGCNMGPGCINHHKTIDEIERSIAYRSEQLVQIEESNQKLRNFLAKVTENCDFTYSYYKNLSSYNNIKIPSRSELTKIYKDMHKVEHKDFRNCAACGYNSCFYMATVIFNGLNKVENCHLYQEKELLKEQKTLNSIIKQWENINKQLQEEIAERKVQEQLLVHNSKLAAMGEMIGMIAHQWRQPLSSISTIAGNLKVLIDLEMYDKDEFVKLLGEINNHSQYLSRTINDFRHFFKPDNPKDMVLINDIVDATLGIIGKSLEYKNINLVKEYSFTNPIFIYPNELMQVFLNIIKNATDALVENRISNPKITIKGYETDGYQIVEIIDNAGGIPDEIIDRIYNPYFSTKGTVGTGLGLYMSRTIIEEHCGGTIKAHNHEEGACFTITLPFNSGERVNDLG